MFYVLNFGHRLYIRLKKNRASKLMPTLISIDFTNFLKLNTINS